MTWADWMNYFYIFMILMISIYGLHAVVISILYLLHYRRPDPPVPDPREWPKVAVQLPLYNEQALADRMIDLVSALDYPKDKLVIQILDDSTDTTTEFARRKAQCYRALGFNIQVLHRDNRSGFKARALHGGYQKTDAEFFAVFDADFAPPPDFLKRVIPGFYADPCIGMLQTRWGHSNPETNLLTRLQALFLDGHQIVEQVARSRSDLLLNFNGTGGIWRAECLADSGGWQWDTMAEDIDISYRAQMRGWKLVFLPDIVVPGEIPDTLKGFKKQQNRWTFGHVQVFRKLLPKVWAAPRLNFWQKAGATFHMTTNFMQVGALLMFLLCVPLALSDVKQPSSLGLISLASSGPTLLFAVSQIFGYRDGFRAAVKRLLYLPMLVLAAVGLTLSNTGAVLSVFAGRKLDWAVTPKAGRSRKPALAGATPLSVWLEIALSIYCAVGLSLALQNAPALIPLSALGMLGFGFVGCTSLVEHNRASKTSHVQVELVSKKQ